MGYDITAYLVNDLNIVVAQISFGYGSDLKIPFFNLFDINDDNGVKIYSNSELKEMLKRSTVEIRNSEYRRNVKRFLRECILINKDVEIYFF